MITAKINWSPNPHHTVRHGNCFRFIDTPHATAIKHTNPKKLMNLRCTPLPNKPFVRREQIFSVHPKGNRE